MSSGIKTLECDVLVLCAGFGTRLRPLTEITPKPLLEVGGKALIERHLEHLKREGAECVVLNLHHLGEKIRAFVGDGSRFGLEVVYSEEQPILDTGGAIKNIEPLLKHQDLLTINADIVIDPQFSYARLWQAHRACSPRPLATMLLRKDRQQKSYGEIERDAAGRIVGFLGTKIAGYAGGEAYMFPGIQIVSRELLDILPPRGTPCSITRDVLQAQVGRGAYLHSATFDGPWHDIGTPERLEAARREFR